MITSYYYFMRQADSAEPTQVFYKISVGRSMREYNALILLERFALDTGAFLRPVDDISDMMLQQRAEAIFPDREYPRLYLRSAQLNVLSLYKLIENDKLDAYEDEMPMPRAHRRFFEANNCPASRPSIYKAKARICHAEPRKNLSHWGRVFPTSVAIKCICVIVLFLLSGCLEGMERGLY